MALSPNYGWAEPDNSSLVKNGAQDIRALGDAIDTSVWNVGYGQAGKNKIINGDFRINQRGFTSTTATSTYIFDRWRTTAADGTSTFTAQTFTPGAAPVAGYESTNFLDVASTGQTLTSARTSVEQRIEDVRTFAGQTVTVSFWAKAASGTPSICPELAQIFGSGGSASVTAIGATKIPITTSWARYTVSGIAVPSVSGKTIGTGSELRFTFWTSAGSAEATRSASLGIQTATISLWGVQVEYGSKATPFQTASGGSIEGELAMCQRYYYRASSTGGYKVLGNGFAGGVNDLRIFTQLPVTMRIVPTVTDTSAMSTFYYENPGSTGTTPTSINLSNVTSDDCGVVGIVKTAAFISGAPYTLMSNNVAAFLGFGAEL
jgi:hypothetical protein